MPMSGSSIIKIKIPAKATTEYVTKAAPLSRKPLKRRITSDDGSDVAPSSPKTHTKPTPKKPRLSPKVGSEDDNLPRATVAKTTSSTAPSAKRSIKRKTWILSDEEDDDFVPQPDQRNTVSTSKTKDVKGKTKASGSVKVTARDESKPGPSGSSGYASKKRPRDQEESEVDITTVPVLATVPVLTSAPAPEDSPPKKKLPPIKKKNKLDSAATSASASPAPASAAAPKSVGKPGTDTAKPPAPSTATLQKKPHLPIQATTTNPSGSGDFDLRDTSTWESIIGKGTSGPGPRVGIEKRVSTEERRKQLDEMRERARLAREQQFRETFDLQAQSCKITAFEKKLQQNHVVKINGPHILGAAFLARPVPGARPR